MEKWARISTPHHDPQGNMDRYLDELMALSDRTMAMLDLEGDEARDAYKALKQSVEERWERPADAAAQPDMHERWREETYKNALHRARNAMRSAVPPAPGTPAWLGLLHGLDHELNRYMALLHQGGQA
jgi:ElaB/YqjD/DUF883 family membrane-anchored ribosome-binding protein